MASNLACSRDASKVSNAQMVADASSSENELMQILQFQRIRNGEILPEKDIDSAAHDATSGDMDNISAVVPTNNEALNFPVTSQPITYEAISCSGASTTERFHRYEFSYTERGPLLLNVIGRANADSDGNVESYSIVVDSFETYPNGQPGQSELSGLISLGDVIVGVNDCDLTNLRKFSDGMKAIQLSDWPKTLHFLHDSEYFKYVHEIESIVHMEGWLVTIYPSRVRKKKRYLTLSQDTLCFMKIDPNGSVTQDREAYFKIDQLVRIRPIENVDTATDRRHILRLTFKMKSKIYIVGSRRRGSLEPMNIEILELCFGDKQDLHAWCRCIANPMRRSSSRSPSFVPPIPIDMSPPATANRTPLKEQLEKLLRPTKGQLAAMKELEVARQRAASPSKFKRPKTPTSSHRGRLRNQSTGKTNAYECPASVPGSPEESQRTLGALMKLRDDILVQKESQHRHSHERGTVIADASSAMNRSLNQDDGSPSAGSKPRPKSPCAEQSSLSISMSISLSKPTKSMIAAQEEFRESLGRIKPEDDIWWEKRTGKKLPDIKNPEFANTPSKFRDSSIRRRHGFSVGRPRSMSPTVRRDTSPDVAVTASDELRAPSPPSNPTLKAIANSYKREVEATQIARLSRHTVSSISKSTSPGSGQVPSPTSSSSSPRGVSPGGTWTPFEQARRNRRSQSPSVRSVSPHLKTRTRLEHQLKTKLQSAYELLNEAEQKHDEELNLLMDEYEERLQQALSGGGSPAFKATGAYERAGVGSPPLHPYSAGPSLESYQLLLAVSEEKGAASLAAGAPLLHSRIEELMHARVLAEKELQDSHTYIDFLENERQLFREMADDLRTVIADVGGARGGALLQSVEERAVQSGLSLVAPRGRDGVLGPERASAAASSDAGSEASEKALQGFMQIADDIQRDEAGLGLCRDTKRSPSGSASSIGATATVGSSGARGRMRHMEQDDTRSSVVGSETESTLMEFQNIGQEIRLTGSVGNRLVQVPFSGRVQGGSGRTRGGQDDVYGASMSRSLSVPKSNPRYNQASERDGVDLTRLSISTTSSYAAFQESPALTDDSVSNSTLSQGETVFTGISSESSQLNWTFRSENFEGRIIGGYDVDAEHEEQPASLLPLVPLVAETAVSTQSPELVCAIRQLVTDLYPTAQDPGVDLAVSGDVQNDFFYGPSVADAELVQVSEEEGVKRLGRGLREEMAAKPDDDDDDVDDDFNDDEIVSADKISGLRKHFLAENRPTSLPTHSQQQPQQLRHQLQGEDHDDPVDADTGKSDQESIASDAVLRQIQWLVNDLQTHQIDSLELSVTNLGAEADDREASSSGSHLFSEYEDKLVGLQQLHSVVSRDSSDEEFIGQRRVRAHGRDHNNGPTEKGLSGSGNGAAFTAVIDNVDRLQSEEEHRKGETEGKGRRLSPSKAISHRAQGQPVAASASGRVSPPVSQGTTSATASSVAAQSNSDIGSFTGGTRDLDRDSFHALNPPVWQEDNSTNSVQTLHQRGKSGKVGDHGQYAFDGSISPHSQLRTQSPTLSYQQSAAQAWFSSSTSPPPKKQLSIGSTAKSPSSSHLYHPSSPRGEVVTAREEGNVVPIYYGISPIKLTGPAKAMTTTQEDPFDPFGGDYEDGDDGTDGGGDEVDDLCEDDFFDRTDPDYKDEDADPVCSGDASEEEARLSLVYHTAASSVAVAVSSSANTGHHHGAGGRAGEGAGDGPSSSHSPTFKNRLVPKTSPILLHSTRQNDQYLESPEEREEFTAGDFDNDDFF